MSGVSNKEEEEKSDEYSQDMTQAMGAGSFYILTLNTPFFTVEELVLV